MTLRLSSFGPKGPTSLTRRYKVYLVGPEGLASQQQYLQPFLEIESHKWMVNATPPPSDEHDLVLLASPEYMAH